MIINRKERINGFEPKIKHDQLSASISESVEKKKTNWYVVFLRRRKRKSAWWQKTNQLSTNGL